MAKEVEGEMIWKEILNFLIIWAVNFVVFLYAYWVGFKAGRKSRGPIIETDVPIEMGMTQK